MDMDKKWEIAREEIISDQQKEIEKLKDQLKACREALEDYQKGVAEMDKDLYEKYFEWTCPRCGAKHPSTKNHCPCEAEVRGD